MPVDIVTGDRDLFQLVDDNAEVRVLYIARGVAKHERMTEHAVRREVRRPAPAVRRLRDPARRRVRRPARRGRGRRQDGGQPAAVVRRPGRASERRRPIPASALGPGPRGKINAASDYLDVAPTVVAVARDIDLGSPDHDPARPRRRDPDALAAARRALGAVQPGRAPHRGAGRPLRAAHSVSGRVGHDPTLERGHGLAARSCATARRRPRRRPGRPGRAAASSSARSHRRPGRSPPSTSSRSSPSAQR